MLPLDVHTMLGIILAVIVIGFVNEFLMLRRLRLLTRALGVLVLQESQKIRRLRG